MTPENFVYWLQGFMELQDPTVMDSSQIEIIQDHLNLVLGKVTPDRRVYHVDMGDLSPEAAQEQIDEIVRAHRGWGTGLDNAPKEWQGPQVEWERPPHWGGQVCSSLADTRTISLC